MDNEARSEAARQMGRARTPAKIEAARATAASRVGTKWTEEQRANLRKSQQERRQREREEKANADQSGTA